MLRKIADNKYVDAFLQLMLYSAGFHLIILAIKCFLEKSAYPLNFFTILSLDILFPNIFKNNLIYDFVSWAVALMIYIFLWRIKRF